MTAKVINLFDALVEILSEEVSQFLLKVYHLGCRTLEKTTEILTHPTAKFQ